jgi:hypothetical protein
MAVLKGNKRYVPGEFDWQAVNLINESRWRCIKPLYSVLEGLGTGFHHYKVVDNADHDAWVLSSFECSGL